MSQPISMCLVYKAALGDEECVKRLTEAMDYNLRYGSYTTFPCDCKPPCPVPTQGQLQALNLRVTQGIEIIQAKRAKRACRSSEPSGSASS